jgi:anti-anti-sigma regulatory factor
MEIRTETVPANVPVTIMYLQGELDASCYLEVTEAARRLVSVGTNDLLMDLSELTFISSSGLVTLHSIAMLLRGEQPLDPEGGWNTFGAISNEVESSDHFEAHFKLLNPQPQVQRALTVTGFDRILEVFTDRDLALVSF